MEQWTALFEEASRLERGWTFTATGSPVELLSTGDDVLSNRSEENSTGITRLRQRLVGDMISSANSCLHQNFDEVVDVHRQTCLLSKEQLYGHDSSHFVRVKNDVLYDTLV